MTVQEIEAAFLRKAAKAVSKAATKRETFYDIRAKAELARDHDRKLQIDRIILEAKNGLDCTVCRTAIASVLDFRGLLREMEISGDAEGDDDYYEELIGVLRRGESVRLDCVRAEDLKRYGFDSQ